MNTLYIECNMGAAGDMLMSALYEICEQKDFFLKTMNHAFSKYGISVSAEPMKKCGISGTHMNVLIGNTAEGEEHEKSETHHSHTHATYASISEQIKELLLPEPVKKNAGEIYQLIGDAEAKVHNTGLEQIHFHEVGSLDALADVCGCALLIHLIAPDKILASPLHAGSGFVKCAHGVLPVPAPATAELLKGIPFYSGSIVGELLTPTGAAILKHYVEDFTSMPVMTLNQTGYGMGKKDFEIANCVRIFSGEMKSTEVSISPEAPAEPEVPDYDDKILSISCNLDDMTGEALSYASEVLLNEGALDVYTIPIQMKKGRPGVILTCLCELNDKEKFTGLFFKHTTTRGIRYATFERAKLTSTFETLETSAGEVHIKKSSGYDVTHIKPEFEDLKTIASETGLSLEEVLKLLDEN